MDMPHVCVQELRWRCVLVFPLVRRPPPFFLKIIGACFAQPSSETCMPSGLLLKVRKAAVTAVVPPNTYVIFNPFLWSHKLCGL